MSKSKNDDHLDNQNDSDLSKSDGNNSGLPTIEEHAEKLNIDAPVFAAVMQSNKWACGKKVPEDVFEKAVKDFLCAPIGGI